jgi:hypothetical protein
MQFALTFELPISFEFRGNSPQVFNVKPGNSHDASYGQRVAKNTLKCRKCRIYLASFEEGRLERHR